MQKIQGNKLLNEKSELRRHFLEQRFKLERFDIQSASQKIAIQAFANFYLLSINVGVYFPIRNEVDPLHLFSLGVQNLSLPRINEKKELEFKFWEPNEKLEESFFGTKAPQKKAIPVIPTIIIIPLVAFDENKTRLGYGGGYYDRYLKNFEGLKIGFAFEVQKYNGILPKENFDIPLDYIITEDRIY